MAPRPREETPLVSNGKDGFEYSNNYQKHMSLDEDPDSTPISSSSASSSIIRCCQRKWILLPVIVAAVIFVVVCNYSTVEEEDKPLQASGPYKLVEKHAGENFFDHYEFYDGADSLGSAGYNTYVNEQRAREIGIINTTILDDDDDDDDDDNVSVYMLSAPTKKGPRESIRLEGKRRYNRGLFILDMEHMPAGPGVWPAFWLTDEDNWPKNGEIDIVEGINNQTRAKTALHTSAQCSMYAHVPEYAKTGYWDRATGIYDTFTGQPNYQTDKEADDCWNMAPHQWGNQGCVLINDEDDTIGEPFNERGGGVYALEWDPANGYIKSWSFSKDTIPPNLEQVLKASNKEGNDGVTIDPSQWGLPYAYFAIGDASGCSADHFKNMHIVFNLAFCGTVAGNRFFKDCPEEMAKYNVSNKTVDTCNAYIASNPEALDEAYWKIRGVYVYEREIRIVPQQHAQQGGKGEDDST